MHLKKIISLIVSSAMMASILTVPKADSKTDIHLPKSDIVFAADSEMPATSTSTTTITATTTTPKKTTSSNFTTTTTTKQITTTTSSTPDKVINGTEVDRFDSIKTMPTKTIYAEGEELDLTTKFYFFKSVAVAESSFSNRFETVWKIKHFIFTDTVK